jgi:hypothetical protein
VKFQRDFAHAFEIGQRRGLQHDALRALAIHFKKIYLIELVFIHKTRQTLNGRGRVPVRQSERASAAAERAAPHARVFHSVQFQITRQTRRQLRRWLDRKNRAGCFARGIERKHAHIRSNVHHYIVSLNCHLLTVHLLDKNLVHQINQRIIARYIFDKGTVAQMHSRNAFDLCGIPRHREWIRQ